MVKFILPPKIKLPLAELLIVILTEADELFAPCDEFKVILADVSLMLTLSLVIPVVLVAKLSDPTAILIALPKLSSILPAVIVIPRLPLVVIVPPLYCVNYQPEFTVMLAAPLLKSAWDIILPGWRFSTVKVGPLVIFPLLSKLCYQYRWQWLYKG